MASEAFGPGRLWTLMSSSRVHIPHLGPSAMGIDKRRKHPLFALNSTLHNQRALTPGKERYTPSVRCRSFNLRANASYNFTRRKKEFKSHPRTWGHDGTLNSTVALPGMQTGHCRTRAKGQGEGGHRAREGARKGAGAGRSPP